MQCKVAMFSISPRILFSSFGSLFFFHLDSLFPRLLPIKVLQSVIKKANEHKWNVVKLPPVFWEYRKNIFPFPSSLCPSISSFPFSFGHSCSYSLFLTLSLLPYLVVTLSLIQLVSLEVRIYEILVLTAVF